MARYQVILAYDGTDFYGSQRQAMGPKSRTIQASIESALRQIGWQDRAILSAGRTDTGVHARGQVIAFDLDWDHSPEDLRAALNANLPLDVAVKVVNLVSSDFHPRYDALARRYCYRIFCQPARDPLRDRYAWRVWPPVTLEPMQEAASYLPGSHDFAAFGAPPRAGGPTVRSVLKAEWQEEQDELTFEIVANAFLFHMVRRLVGFQVSIGQGRFEPDAICNYLDRRSSMPVKCIAPPQGLTLMEVIYFI